MRNKYKPAIIILTLLIATFLITSTNKLIYVSASEPSEPHAANAMWVEPSTIELSTDTHPVGYKFNITVWINLTVTCGAWEIKLIYNKNYLNATRTGLTAGTTSEFFQGKFVIPVMPTFGPVNATHDYVLYGEAILTAPYREPGYGSLCWIEFEVIAQPEAGETLTTKLDLSTFYPSETYALDDAGQKIDLTIYNAIYTYSSAEAPPPPPPPSPVTGTTIAVSPPEIIDPTMTPGSTFSINITILNVTDLKKCKFNLTYNTNIISWISFNVFEVENQTPTAITLLNDQAGYIWVELTYPTSLSTEEAIPIVGIQFKVDALGATPLDLNQTELLDSEDQPIEHQTQDGLFMTLIRDVCVTDVIVNVEWTYQGWPVNITVKVRNEGNINETLIVSTYYDDALITNITVTNLPPNSETALNLTWDTTNVEPCSNYTISARAHAVPYEFDLTDNYLANGKVKVRYFGDTNGDNRVDIQDVYNAASAFGSYPGHPRWDPTVDMDRNGIIDISDVFAIATHFGEGCP